MFAPEFNPIAFSIGPLAVHWYGLMYLLGFAFFWALGRLRAKDPWRQMTANDVEDILFYGVLGVILGGRLGFCFFYQPEWPLVSCTKIKHGPRRARLYEFRQKKCTAGVHFFAENLARGSSPCFKRRAQTRRHASWGNNIKIL